MKYLILLLALFTLPAHADDGILVIGDSTSLGAIPYIQNEMPCVVHAPGNSRDSTYIRENIAGWLFGKHYRGIYFNSGLWDVAHRAPTARNPWRLDPTLQSTISDDEWTYENNLAIIISIARAFQPNAWLVFATSTDVPKDSIGRIPVELRHYNKYAKQVMADDFVEVDDRYAFMLPYAHLHKTDVPNKVHYLPRGYRVMAKHEVEVFKSHGGC